MTETKKRRRYSERGTAQISERVFLALHETKAMTTREIADMAGTTRLRAAAVLNNLAKNRMAAVERINTKTVAWRAR